MPESPAGMVCENTFRMRIRVLEPTPLPHSCKAAAAEYREAGLQEPRMMLLATLRSVKLSPRVRQPFHQ
jgi:hypothetical protein